MSVKAGSSELNVLTPESVTAEQSQRLNGPPPFPWQPLTRCIQRCPPCLLIPHLWKAAAQSLPFLNISYPEDVFSDPMLLSNIEAPELGGAKD